MESESWRLKLIQSNSLLRKCNGYCERFKKSNLSNQKTNLAAGAEALKAPAVIAILAESGKKSIEVYNPYKNILRMDDSEFYTGLLKWICQKK